MFLLLIIPIGLIYLMTKKKTFSSEFFRILASQKMRNDAFGLGHYGAPRGNHTHQGVDLKVHKNVAIKAPFDGVVRNGFVYNGDNKFQLVEVKNGIDKIKIMYVNPSRINHSEVLKGETIGYAQAISEKYNASMQDHIHVQLYKNGELVDPTNLLLN